MKKEISFFVKLLQEFFSLLIIVDHRVFADIRLEPSNGIVSENTSFTWNCTFSPIDSFISWKVNDNGTAYIDQQKCTGTGFLNERDKYKTDCGTGWISVQIRNVNRNNNGEEWHCQIVGTFQGQKVTLQVQGKTTLLNISSPDLKKIE
ncbi:uncharacterized protein LOC132719529 [Ruditapes philippinarum]|uniref:uncharacterized protein LOC132719529 n=1 Tax=Ruditapes philippinarum TaxID=129788 RepID=UPI00295B5831|nr:uncharacterized protein LOC132719529 [Ruditapes philippinarum]